MGKLAAARDQWGKSWDFLFAVVGASVGLGNIWRFPYLCFKNGGGAFLIPYLIFAILIAVPILILEISLGQRVRKGIVESWRLVPVFQGMAVTGTMVNFYSTLAYPVILVWVLKYLTNSFRASLPWSSCGNAWNTNNCVTPASLINLTSISCDLSSRCNATQNTSAPVSSTTEYFVHEVLHLSSGIEEPGNIVKDLVLYLAIFWVTMYLCTFRGIKWMTKVVYVTATLPFLLIFVILIRGVTLDGAADGLKYYLIPDLERLKDPSVWIGAGSQVFYSFSLGGSTLITMASFNKKNHDFWRNSFLIGCANLLTSFLGGVAVFSALGYMAKYQNTTVEHVAKSGPGLVFVAYPETISLLPLPQLWSVLFFLCILLLGIDSQFANLEAVMTALFDNFDFLKSNAKLVRAGCYAIAMLVDLSMVTEGGVYVFEIFNNYGLAGWSLFLIVTCESIAIGWLYGFENYWKEIVKMIGVRRGKTWLKISWEYVTPVTCAGITMYFLCTSQPIKYENYFYPLWGQIFAQLVAVSPISFLFGFAIYKIITNRAKGRSFSHIRRSFLDQTNACPTTVGMNPLNEHIDIRANGSSAKLLYTKIDGNDTELHITTI